MGRGTATTAEDSRARMLGRRARGQGSPPRTTPQAPPRRSERPSDFEPFTVHRRTFEAKRHPQDSNERWRLNGSSLTSEYLTSHRYAVLDGLGRPMRTFRTKREAVAYVEERAGALARKRIADRALS